MRISRHLLIWLVPAALAGCAAIGISQDEEQPVRVIDLKMRVTPIGWKDNETIVAIGDNGERYARADGETQTVLRVMTINYKTGQRQIFGKAGGEFCFSQGRVMYVFPDRATDELWLSYGELGKEITQKIRPGELTFDRRACQPWTERPAPPAWADGKVDVLPLWPRLGLINCNVRPYSLATRHIKASFHQRDDQKGVDLPFSCFDVRRGFEYYEFKRAFFTAEHADVSPWPVDRDRRAYWLYPDGTVETIVLPYSSAIRESMLPTARGIIAFGRPASREEDYGVYLVTSNRTIQILPGNAGGSTSPDGCKVAILHDPQHGTRLDRRPANVSATLKVLELCPE